MPSPLHEAMYHMYRERNLQAAPSTWCAGAWLTSVAVFIFVDSTLFVMHTFMSAAKSNVFCLYFLSAALLVFPAFVPLVRRHTGALSLVLEGRGPVFCHVCDYLVSN
jgi:hypothetical protein